MKRFEFIPYTNAQRYRRDAWNPKVEDGFVLNGCLEADDYDAALFEVMQAEAVSFNFSTLYTAGDMPVIRWDADFETFLEKQGSIIDVLRAERTRCVLPWAVLDHLPETQRQGTQLYFSQGSQPSCMGHAHAFAQHSSTLTWIGLGASLIYEPFNPYVTWIVSKGGSTRGGQSPGPMAKAGNGQGNYPISCVGAENQKIPDGYERFNEIARKHQSGVVFLPGAGTDLAQNIVRCCRAGLGVAVGNSTAVRSASPDSNGVKVAVLGGSWAHATSFTGFRTVKGIEYVFWVNSHGKRYGVSDEGEPADGAWMRTEKELISFCSTMTCYGAPYAIIPEAVMPETASSDQVAIPFPTTWRT